MTDVMELRKKTIDAAQLKDFDDEAGTVTALVNTLGVIDADGDRILSGAFSASLADIGKKTIAVLWGHQATETVGKVIDGEEVSIGDGVSALYVTMLMNLKTSRGRDAYEDLKFNGGIVKEWSVGFNVPDEKDIEYVTDPDGTKVTNIKNLELVEVSAVLRGSSPGTTTISIKSADKEKGALPSHDTPTSDENWDGPEVIASLPNDDEDVYKRVFAWVNSDANEDTKSAYKFPHHDYPGTSANLRACSSIIAILNGSMGGTSIPAADRKGVWNHAARHLRDGGRDVPELKSQLPGKPNKYTTRTEAEARAVELGCSGAHQMEDGDLTFWMPCANHSLYNSAVSGTPSANIYSSDADVAFKEAHTEQKAAAARLLQAVAARLVRVRLKWLKNKNKGDN